MDAEAGGCGARKILYIDDDPHFGIIARGMLERIGHQVTVFECPLQGLAALSASPAGWDMVITDFRMPRMNGLEVAREVSRQHPGLRIAVVSHCVGGDAAIDVLSAGLGPMLPKPCTVHEFKALIEQVARQPPQAH